MTATDTVRLRFDLSYDGTLFHGWAAQPGLRTVEGELTRAVETILRQPVQFTVAGRTDAGVHALSQVAHVDVPDPGQSSALVKRVNGLLAAGYSQALRARTLPGGASTKGQSDVLVNKIARVDPSFDARFSALSRRYEYQIAGAGQPRDPLTRGQVWWPPYAGIDPRVMNEGGRILQGEHDFLSFCRPRPGATTIRTLEHLRVADSAPLRVQVQGDAFCHSMVRSLVGALVDVGRGVRSLEWLQALVAEPSRDHGVPVAPAHGLTLVGVDYPEPQRWAQQADAARVVR